MGLREEIGKGPAALDTSIFIYWLEDHPRFAPVIEPIFRAVTEGQLHVFTSALTLLEVLIAPLRDGDRTLESGYLRFLTRSSGVSLVDVDRRILLSAARLRATTRLRTPDAIQVATALSVPCSCFVTNDGSLTDVGGVRILKLADYATPPTAIHGPHPRRSGRGKAGRSRGDRRR